MSTKALELVGVERWFGHGGDAVHAVRSVDLEVPAGSVLGVLGPNGAGKTTTVKMASTLLEPSRGSVLVDGIDAVRHPRAARARLGLVLGGDRGFYLRASGIENLRFFATLAGLSHRHAESRIAELLDRVGLAGRERQRVETYSRGMRQRLHLARAVLAAPALLLLDEPSIGLDPEGTRDLRELVRELRASGCGILLTTHQLQEADELADALVVIDHGRVVSRGSAADVAAAGGVDTVVTFATRELLPAARARIEAHPRVVDLDVRPRGNGHEIDLVGCGLDTDLLRAFGSELRIDWVTQRPVTLEEAYLAFVARRGTP